MSLNRWRYLIEVLKSVHVKAGLGEGRRGELIRRHGVKNRHEMSSRD